MIQYSFDADMNSVHDRLARSRKVREDSLRKVCPFCEALYFAGELHMCPDDQDGELKLGGEIE
jgi:hypothetical protein